MAAVIDRSTLLSDVASILEVDVQELDDDTNLLDAGLDSIRLMSLVEKWKSDGVDNVDFLELAADPVVGSWVSIVVPA
ncbi:phosphopantetheine-binding protein [Rhodococcoides yunnanense]|uniref:phosphopantetheine-binding protein n=1 Tax=Rhodococcoides yunnanense TaxID=278209 RepID=UPI00093312DD|nr:phosphopantetheine-binding protein [Rhodococcus yunnanensis]